MLVANAVYAVNTCNISNGCLSSFCFAAGYISETLEGEKLDSSRNARPHN